MTRNKGGGDKMAGGDKAKSSGEYGEQIVANLLKMIGWINPESAVKIPCIKNELHRKDGTEKCLQHGVDYLYQYKSPLNDLTRHDVLISVKCYDGYPAGTQGCMTKFKSFFLELAQGTECYPRCDSYKNKIPGTTKRKILGLIFWIDREQGDNKQYESVVDKIGSFYFREECNYDTICLVDNKRAQFIYEVISKLNSDYGKENVKFFYIDTGLNNSSLNKITSGAVMPYEYINSNVIPFAINIDSHKLLYLAVNENFCESYLKRLISLAHSITQDWAEKIIIGFPDFNLFEHKNEVAQAKRAFEDDNFIQKIDVVTYRPNFRDEV